MKTLLVNIFILCSFSAIWSQDVSNAEYYWNADPGLGQGTALSVTNSGATIDETYTIPVPVGLDIGVHNLFVRVKDTDGTWSMTKIYKYILFSTAETEITASEYYWDTDPGAGQGTALAIATQGTSTTDTYMIPIPSGLSVGVHNLFVRSKDGHGVWSMTKLYKYILFSTAEAEITASEYYWDTDPGAGQGTALAIATQGTSTTDTYTIPVPSGLSAGVHNLFVRSKDGHGVWSMTKLYKFLLFETIDVVAAEYYWDTDPGFGSATDIPLTTTAPNIMETFMLPTLGISNGVHTLTVRVKDDKGVWSMLHKASYIIAIGIYVDHTAIGANDGSSWTDAYTNLNDAVAASTDTTPGIIHIAEGTYYPDNNTGDRSLSFDINNSTTILAGYPSGGDIPENRDPETYEVILSGDIGVAETHTDNSYHVVKTDGVSNVSVDGLTIAYGYANGSGDATSGGGWLNDGQTNASNPSITHCSFRDNYALWWGGAMYNDATASGALASPIFSDCLFENNSADRHGGAIFNYALSGGKTSPEFTNCIFNNNTSLLYGGAVLNEGNSSTSNPFFTNCIFFGNTGQRGGALANFGNTNASIINCSFANNTATLEGEHIHNQSSNGNVVTTVVNSIFDDTDMDGDIFFYASGATLDLSYSIIDGPLPTGTTDGGNNILNTDPKYIDPANGNLTLKYISLAIDAGDNAANTETTDLGGNTRILNGIINMGAYEQETVLPIDFFITTWETTVDAESVLLLIDIGETYDYTIDWGDDSIDFSQTGDASHTYAVAGSYIVSISGTYPRIDFSDQDQLQEINQWGTQIWTSMNGAFSGCTNLTEQAVNGPDLSLATDMQSMFENCTALNQDISNWDVSNITQMGSAFKGCTTFNQDISAWNVGTVIDMTTMFENASAYDKSIRAWDVTNVQTMTGLFDGVTLSTAVYDDILIGWATQNLQANGDLSGGNSTYCNAADARQNMIDNDNWLIIDGGLSPTCPEAADYFITTWQTTTTNESITIPTTGGGYNYEVIWGDGTINDGHTGNAIHTYATAGIYEVKISGDFPRIYFNNSGSKNKIVSIDQWGTQVWTSMERAFYGCSNLAGQATDVPALSIVTTMILMFSNASSWNQDMNNWNVSNVQIMSSLFQSASVFDKDLGNWNVSNVNDMNHMFAGASNFNKDINSWTVSNVINMFRMFELTNLFNQELNNWNVSNVQNMSRMFKDAPSFDQNLDSWNMSGVTDMSLMFENSTLSTPNYDALLIGWDAQTLQPNINFHGGNSQYCYAESARNNMITNDGWTIVDGGEQTGCDPLTPQFTLSLGDYNCVNDMYDISVEVTGLGGGTTVDITNDSGGNEHLSVGIGTYQIGSFAAGTVAVTVTDTDNSPSTTALTYDIACPCGTEFEWTGAEDNFWSNPNNWCQGGLPGIGDDVILLASAINEPHVDINVHILSLEISKPLTVLAGDTLVVDNTTVYKADFHNFGVMDVNSVGGQFYSSYNYFNETGGELILTAGIQLQKDTFINNGLIIMESKGIEINKNSGVVSAAALFENNGQIEMSNFGANNFVIAQGAGITIRDDGTFVNNGSIDMENVDGFAVFCPTDNLGELFENNGEINIDGSRGIRFIADFVNTNLINMINVDYHLNNKNQIFSLNGSFDNSGTIYATSATKNGFRYFFNTPLSFTNTGTIEIDNGDFNLFEFKEDWTNDGSIQGSGIIKGNLTNNGTLIPGASPGIITCDSAYVHTGEIEFEVLGLGGAGEVDGHDQLILNTDNNTLGGTISVTSTYTANPGDIIVLISATDGYTGTFATTNLPPNESGHSWVISYEATEVILSLGPLCYAPSDLVTSNLSETSADLSWTPGGNCALDGTYWVQSIQDPPPTIGVGGEIVTCGGTLPVTATGLTAGVTYNVYVYESCGTGIDVGPELVGSFTTWMDCDPDGQFSLDFDGVNDDIQDLDNLGLGTEFSVEYWINPQSSQSSYAQPIGYSHTSTKSWTMQYASGSTWRMALGNGAGNFINFSLIPDEWQHLSFIVTETEMTLYVNGVEIESASLSSPIQYTGTEVLDIGSWFNGSSYSRYYKGQLDEIRIWNYALSSADILARLNTELVGNETDLIAYYNFNDGSGSTILSDLTSNDYDGTLTNMDPNTDWLCGFEPIPCLQASVLSTTNIGGTEATANWSTNGGTDFEVIIGETGFTIGAEEQTFNVTGASVLMTGLEDGKSYDWYVRAACDSNTYSIYTGPETFTINNTSLDFSTNTEFLTHIVAPLTGLPQDLYRFEVNYTNTEGTFPTSAYPRLLIDEDGNGTNDQLITMMEVDTADSDVTNGKLYFVELTGLQPGDEYKLAVEDVKPNGFKNTLGPIDELEVFQPVDVRIYAADISFSDDNPDPNTSLTITATIHNESSFDANNFSASLYNEFDSTTYPIINNITVLSGDTTDISWTITTPVEVAFVPLRVSLDINNVLVEPNELDNDAVRPFLNGPFIIGDADINVVAELTVVGDSTVLTGTATYSGIPDIEDEPVAGGDVEFELIPLGAVFNTHTNNNGQFSYTFLTPAVGYNVEGTVTDLFLVGEFSVGPCLAELTAFIEPLFFANEGELHSFDVTFSNNGCLGTVDPYTASVIMPDGIPTSINVAIPALGPSDSYTENIDVTYTTFGDKIITVESDINEDIIESNENNNETSRAIYVLCAGVDLRAEAVNYNPSFVTIDECGFQFNLPIINYGVTTSVETTAKVEKMKGATLVKTDYYTIPPLTSLETFNISFFDIFDNVGAYTYIVTADDSNDQVECLENNQLDSTLFNVISCGRDLIIGYCATQDVTTVDGTPGDIVTISTVVRSIGGTDIIGDFDVQFITLNDTVALTHTGGLANGSSVTLTADMAIPISGSLSYSVLVDSGNDITELSESNNTYIGVLNYDFTLAAFCSPNYLMFWEKIYTPFQPINMQIGLRNWGNLKASEVGVHFEVVAGPGITSPVDLGTVLVNNVERVCACPRSIFLANPASLSMTGTYTIRMTADSDNDYSESDESNNVLEVQVTVTSDPDFATESQFINPSSLNPDLNEAITFTMTYENLGETYLNQFNAKVEVDGIELETISLAGLIQGDDNTVAIITPWSSNAQGIHVVKWILDPLEELVESDETNNIATRLVLVGNAPNPTITAFTVDNTSPNVDEEINFQVVIDNEGDVDADIILKLFYYNGSGQLVEFYSNAHTSTAVVDIIIDIPWTVLEANTEIIAEISAAVPQEYNEEDNTASLSLNGFDVDIVITNLTCIGADDGTLLAAEIGGIAPLTYLWNNGATTQTISGLGVGEYSVAVTDGLGFVVNETVTLIVEDNIAPVITCTDLTLVLNEFGTVSLQSDNVSITDNCDTTLVPEFSQITFDCADFGENVVTVTAVDIAGNIDTCIMTVTVLDTILPSVFCNDLTVYLDTAGMGTITVAEVDSNSFDNCSIVSLTLDTTIFNCSDLGSNIVTLTAIDAVGNSDSCFSTILVFDTINPTIQCPTTVTVNTDPGLCTASNVNIGMATAMDNCSIDTIINDAPNIFPLGTTIVTWIAYDIVGNTALCQQSITVEDNEMPSVFCNDLSVYLDTAGMGIITTSEVDSNSFDNCTLDSFSLDINTFNCDNLGPNSVVLTAVDGSGNAASCMSTVQVFDTIHPTINCPIDLTINTDPGLCTASNVNIGMATAMDNCSIDTIINDGLIIFPLGTTIITWTAYDVVGNATLCQHSITVEDNEMPSVFCNDLTVYLDTAGMGTITTSELDNNSFDNCTLDSLSLDIYSFNCNNLGSNTITLTAVDGSGNTAFCLSTIHVVDTIHPTIQCPTDITVDTDIGLCTASNVNIGTAVAMDNCSIDSLTNNAPVVFPLGTTIITWTAKDTSENSVSCQQMVTVIDTESPTIQCPVDITVNTDPGLCTASNVNIGMATAMDNCSIDTIINDGLIVFPLGTTIITWTAHDVAGNATLCQQSITVEDNEMPSVFCNDLTVYLNTAGMGTITTSEVDSNSFDNCTLDSLSLDIYSFNCNNLGSNSVILTAVDGSGNAASCMSTVQVFDTIHPTINCPIDLTINTDSGLCTASNVNIGMATAMDNCSIDTIINDGPNIFPLGTTIITWTAHDVAGNATLCQQNITVEDNQMPSVFCNDLTVYLDTAGMGTITTSELDNNSFDNCTLDSLSLDIYSFNCNNLGSNSIALTAVDGSGNAASCLSTILVFDTIYPMIQCPADITVDTDVGFCTASNVNIGTATALDNCSIDTLINDAPNIFTLGTTTVTWTAFDLAGNFVFCQQSITVEDNEMPSVFCHDFTTYLAVDGTATIDVLDIDNNSFDNCTLVSLTLNKTRFECNDLGNNSVTLSAIDALGNAASCISTINVVDTISPTINCPLDMTINTDAGLCEASNVNIGMATAADNCSIDTLTNDAPSNFQLGTTVVTWTAFDLEGNSVTCQQNITVLDILPPSAVCNDITITLDQNGTAQILATDIGNASFDNCGISMFSLSNNTFNCAQIGGNSVELTATDMAGNSSTCTAQVTVQDVFGYCCPQILDITENPTLSGTYTASQTLTSDKKILSTANVIFKAGNEILLNPNFEVEKGAVFEVIIEDCD